MTNRFLQTMCHPSKRQKAIAFLSNMTIIKLNVKIQLLLMCSYDSNAVRGDRPLYLLRAKDPKTVLKAEFQSEYLERRIRKHHSSSRTKFRSISLFKGTKAIMHEYA